MPISEKRFRTLFISVFAKFQDAFAGMGGADIYNVVSSASKMAGGRRQQMASTIQQSFSRPGSTDPLGNLVKGVATTTKLMGKLQSMRAREQESTNGVGEGSDPDDKWDWMTGVPTSIRFVGKSWRNIARGPGGIVTESPVSFGSGWRTLGRRNSSRSGGGSGQDFAATVNMLTMLAKADLKLKSQAREADADSEDSAGLAPTGERMNRRRSTGGGAGGAKAPRKSPTSAQRRSSLVPGEGGKSPEGAGGRIRSASKESNLRTDSEEQV